MTDRRQKVLITGAGGFIGSHVAEACVEAGYGVRALVRYNSRNSWGWLEESAHRDAIEVVSGDVRDYASVLGAMRDCSAVLHLAALIGIPYSYRSPVAYVRTNIEGTYNVLEGTRTLGVDRVIVTSTSEVYGTAQYVPIDENHPLVAQSPYSATKIAADQLTLSYFRSFDLPVTIARPFNTYGPRQSARAVIPTIVSQLLSGATRLNLGNVDPTRDLTFVKDTASAFVALLRCTGLSGEVVNFGMDEEISVGDLAALIGELMGVEVEVIRDADRVRPAASEVQRLRANTAKLRGATGWKPAYDLRRGLVETIEWMRRHQHDYKPELYNV